MIRLTPRQAAAYGIAAPPKGKRGPNKLETRYGAYLATQLAIGEILAFGFEEFKLKIGVKTCWYLPDFWVLTTSGLAFHECKGPFFREAGKIKIKAAALKYPQFRFVLVRAEGSGWGIEVVE